jgi:8-oxo-dGTP diphosphatase
MPTRKKHCYDYPRPMVTVDCVLLREDRRTLQVLLVERDSPPYKGRWALPGGFIRMNEPLEAAVVRELAEETGIKDLSFLIQLGAYGQLGRDPRGRDISVAFIGIIPHGKHPPKAGSDAAEAVWLPVEELPERLAFDHATILGDALRRLAAGGRSSGVLFAFLNDPFTSEQLGDVLHAVYGVPLAPEEYLAPFVKMKIVRRLKRGRDYRFTGWHEGKRR